jgi:spore maturation protein CgeB
MKYKLIKIASYYRSFLNSYYRRNPSIVDQAYEYQLNHLFSLGVGWADFFQKHFYDLDVEAVEVIHNAVPLQQAWVKERNLRNISGRTVVFEQIRAFRPDVVFFQDTLSFSEEFILRLRKEVPSIKVIVGHVCSPTSDDEIRKYRLFNVILCCPALYYFLNSKGLNNLYEFHHGFEASILNSIKENNNFPDSDVLFSGAFFPGSYFHQERLGILDKILENKINLTLFAEIEKESNIRLLARQSAYEFTRLLMKMGLTKVVRQNSTLNKFTLLNEMPEKIKLPQAFAQAKLNLPLYGIEMMKALSKARIGINIHGGIAADYASNVRMFEVTGCGSMLVTDKKSNIYDIFVPGKEIICFDNAQDCIEKISWYLEHEEERSKIAEAGQKRTLKDHSLAQRVKQLHEIIMNNLTD